VKQYGDYREMLLDKDIDAVIISTPDHWHSQPAMEAALAGKHIYVQKPTSLTIKEGRQLVGSGQQNWCSTPTGYTTAF
jgi:Predicted dehydrogenases and related proteins